MSTNAAPLAPHRLTFEGFLDFCRTRQVDHAELVDGEVEYVVTDTPHNDIVQAILELSDWSRRGHRARLGSAMELSVHDGPAPRVIVDATTRTHEPDALVDRHPGRAKRYVDALVIIEVACNTYTKDRHVKLPLYRDRTTCREYWIVKVDVESELATVEVYRRSERVKGAPFVNGLRPHDRADCQSDVLGGRVVIEVADDEWSVRIER